MASSELGGARSTSFQLVTMKTDNLPATGETPLEIDVTSVDQISVKVQADSFVGYGATSAIVTSGTNYFRLGAGETLSFDVSANASNKVYVIQESTPADADGLSYITHKER